jgi:hypothetical protein
MAFLLESDVNLLCVFQDDRPARRCDRIIVMLVMQ